MVPGPTRLVSGVGVGFAHSEAGAEAAAAHYLLELERAMDTLDAQRTAAVAALVATSAEARAIAAHASEVIGLERSGGAPLRRVGGLDRSDLLFAGRRADHRARELDLRNLYAGGAVGDRARLAESGSTETGESARSTAPHRRRTSRSPSCAPSSPSRAPAMRRFASALAALGLAATLLLSSPSPANAGVLSTVGHIVTGAGGAILSVGKGVVCKGLSAAGTVAQGATTVGGAAVGGAEQRGRRHGRWRGGR